MSSIQFRTAHVAEADELTRLAIESKCSWGYSDELISLWKPGLTFTPDNITNRTVSVATNKEELVGVSALRVSAAECELEEFWVRPNSIGRGVGRQLLEHTLGLAAQSGFESVNVVSDPNAEGFYLRLGAVRIGCFESQPAGRYLPVLRVPTCNRHHE